MGNSNKTRYKHVFTRCDNKLREKRFYYEVSLGADPITGKRRKEKSGTDANGRRFTCAKDAHIEVLRIQTEFYQHNEQTESKKTLLQYIEEDFIPDYKTKVRASTFNTKKNIIKILVTRFGNKPLKSITKTDVRNFRSFLVNDPRYGEKYGATILSTLSQILEFAVEYNALHQNVAANVSISKEKTTFIYWTHDEVKRVLQQIDTTDYFNHLVYTMIHFYFYTGVRVNEATYLYWEDIDFDKEIFDVNGTLVKVKEQGLCRQDETKTENGYRQIPLDSHTIKILKEWKKRQSEHGINSDFIFSDTGKPLYAQRISNKMKQFSEKAAVKPLSLQRLRHSNANYLYYDLKIDLEDIRQRFGHKSILTLLRYYIKNVNKPNFDVAQKITDSIG